MAEGIKLCVSVIVFQLHIYFRLRYWQEDK
jgi:hypothetical protein